MASEEPTAAAPAAEEVPAQVPATEEAGAPEASTDPAPAAEDAAVSKPASKPASKKAGAPRKSATGRKPGSKPAEAATNGAEASKKFSVGDTVLGRLKGYPPWPARIVDPESVPRGVLAHRPSKSPSVYCVNYYPAGDFSWLKANEITKLSKDDITKFLSAGHRKATGGLKIAYETAQDPEEWIAKQEEMLRQREEEAENVDELEDDEDEAPTGGKRKRGAVSKPAQKKKAKKTDDEEAPKSKAKASKKGAAPASAVENQAPVDDDPLANDPECVKVKDWRHKLQRAFLGKSLPSASEMDQYHDVFTAIESYKDMTIEALQYSKIGKVMKKIAALDAIPRNDELKLTERAAKLMDDWHNFINNAGGDKTNGDAPKSEAPKSTGKAAAAPAADAAETNGTNGTKEETTNGTAAEEKTEEKMDVEA